MNSLRKSLIGQFGKPTGLLGSLAGLIMRIRPSNRERNARTVDLLEIRPEDHVLEIGFGPGLAVERAAALATRGKVVGIDHSALMLRQATRRNAGAVAAGRVELWLASVEELPELGRSFDKVLAVNVYMFWRDPIAVLTRIRRVMKSRGTIALTLQPRQRGATNRDTLAIAEQMASSLRTSGFDHVRIEILEMSPVAAACALADAGA